MSLELRLVAYEPDGPRLGQLPMFTDMQVTDAHNGLPSLEFGYPQDGVNAAWLLNPLEVAVEYRNGSGWTENRNARFLVLKEDGDFTEVAKTPKYTCSGYAFVLSRAVIEVSAALRSRTGKRTFRDVTPGRLMSAIIDEAKARNNLPGLTYSFSATATSTGTNWLNPAIGLEFEPASDILQALMALSDQGVVDWYMQGRTLVMANSASDISYQRFGRMPVTFETEVNILNWVSTLNGSNDSKDKIFGRPNSYMTASRPAQPAVVQAGSAAKVFASRQHPTNEWLMGQDWATGSDPSRSNKRVALIRHREPTFDEIEDYYFGAMMADWSQPIGQLVAVSEYDEKLRDLAAGVFLDVSGTVALINDSTPEVGAHMDIRSGYMRRAIVLTDSKVSCIELGTFQSDPALPVDVVLQVGAAGPSPWVYEIRDRLLGQGVRVRFDYGDSSLRTTTYDNTPPPAPTGPQMRILPGKNSYYEASIAWDGKFWGGITPADFKHIEVHRSSSGADFTPTDDTIQPDKWTKAGVRKVELRKDTAQWWKFVAVDVNNNKSRPSGCGIVSRGSLPGQTNLQTASKLAPHPGQTPTVVRGPLPADLAQAKMILAERMSKQSGRYLRIKVSSDARDNPSTMTKIRDGIHDAMNRYRPGQPKIQWAAVKETLPEEGAENLDPKVGPVALLPQRDLTEAPHEYSIAGLTSRVYAYGEAFLQTVITNQDDRVAPWGEWESSIAQGGVFDEKDLQILGFKVLSEGSGAKETYTRGLTFDAAKFLPFKDYDAGDIILSPDRMGTMSPMKVASLTVAVDNTGNHTGSISISERIIPVEVRTARALKAVAGGSVGGIATGGSGTRPVAPTGTDSRKPRATFML